MADSEDAFDRLLSSSNSKIVGSSAEIISAPPFAIIANGGDQSQHTDSENEFVGPTHSKETILDDSSDDDAPVTFKKRIIDFKCDEDKNVETNNDHYNLKSDDEEIRVDRKSKKRYMKVVDDSDDESTANSSRRSSSPRRAEVDDVRPFKTQDNNSDSDSSAKTNRSSRSGKSGHNGSSSPGSSSGEGSENEVSIEAIKSKIISKHSAPKFPNLLSEIDSQDPEKKRRSQPKKEKAPSRKAKEAALAEIHSETQRMIRERQISLPYHKPKQRSLADFLNRRKLAPTVRLKTSSDELAKVWKHVEEREKTAEHFYRSESDEETRSKDRVETLDTNSVEITLIPLKNPELVQTNGDDISADISQGCLNQTSFSKTLDTDDFPRLQLSDILLEPELTAEVFSFRNTDALEENSVCLRINTSDIAVDSTEKYTEEVTADQTEDIDRAPGNDSELVENSECALSNILENSGSLFSQNSLSEKISSLKLPIPKRPKISGAPDEVIDLDELSTKPGAFGLMQRFIKHAKLKSKPIKQQNLSVMTSEVNDCGEIISLTEETIKVNKKIEPKPGERLVVLKTTLQQKMAENRGQQLAKKLEEYKLYEEEFYGVTGLDEGEEEMFSEDECTGTENQDDESKDEDIDNPFVENEADESEEDADDEKDEDSEADEDKTDSKETATVLLGSDSDEESDVGKDDDDTYPVSETEDIDGAELNPPTPTALRDLAGTQNAEPVGESQLMALCSGNFSSSTIDLKVLETSSEAFQVSCSQNADVDDFLDPKPPLKPDTLDSDDGEILLSKKSKKRKLSFSDDEDSTKDSIEVLSDSDEDDAIKLSLNDEPVTDRNGESGGEMQEDDMIEEDENDEEVQLAKKLSKGFLDKEAELSESEWGSEDEDEKGLDQYEEEEGDNDKISQRRLRKELGKIHMREVLADDNREIRILQELLLEDGELHSDGPKRQRLFRWYNQGEDNAAEKGSLDLGENAVENEEEDEDLWRRQRLERENYLRKKKIDNLELEIVDNPVSFNDTRKGVKITPKLTPTTNKSPDPKSNFSIVSKRGSFLGRGEKMLTKLAEITNNAGSKENALGNSRNNRNMVFSVLSPPKERQNEVVSSEAPLKRKRDFVATSVVKKIKFTRNNATTKVSALDQLKLFEST